MNLIFFGIANRYCRYYVKEAFEMNRLLSTRIEITELLLSALNLLEGREIFDYHTANRYIKSFAKNENKQLHFKMYVEYNYFNIGYIECFQVSRIVQSIRARKDDSCLTFADCLLRLCNLSEVPKVDYTIWTM